MLNVDILLLSSAKLYHARNLLQEFKMLSVLKTSKFTRNFLMHTHRLAN